MAIAYLLTGSNLGNKSENLHKATTQIAAGAGIIRDSSSVYESPPWGFEHPESFYNQVLSVETGLTHKELMHTLLSIEKLMGRTRPKDGYQARLIDLDILFYDQLIFSDNELEIPHPRLHLRRFTLVPLNEIAPEFLHPVLQTRVKELLRLCKDEGKVTKVSGRTE